MIDKTTITYRLVAYSTDFRWDGESPIPSHRRLSDFLNDPRTVALVLNHATPATWESGAYSELSKTESIALPKRNLLFIVSKTDAPLPSASQYERVPKEPFQVIMYIPPFTLTGRISIPHNADWLNMVTSASEDFFPVTQVSVWHIRARAKLETDAKLVLVNWKWLLGLEPKR